MNHVLSNDSNNIDQLRANIFPTIDEGNTILFLGAGASIGEKKYLGREIIDYYSNKKSIDMGTDDITEFVDLLSANSSFDRNEFDDLVDELLRKYEVTETHEIIASMNWKEIITTNMDLIIEKAFDKIWNTTSRLLELKTVKEWDKYSYRTANDEVKYVKLNGCISDRRKYDLVFSSKDFERANRFYNTVLKGLINLSPKIHFLSVGYSFSDPFAKRLLTRFDKYNYRYRKTLYKVDPNIKDSQLSYFTENKICIIRLTSDEFFKCYAEWEKEQSVNLVKKSDITFSNVNNELIKIPNEIAFRLNNNIMQLTDRKIYKYITAKKFYQGDEPGYEVIKKNYDVIKKSLIDDLVNEFKRISEGESAIIPIMVLKGACGMGKSTLAYRLVKTLNSIEDGGFLSFEIINPNRLKSLDLAELFSSTQAKNIALLFDNIDFDSAFNALMSLRHRLSLEQLNSYNIIIILSVRENILQKYKFTKIFHNLHEINVDRALTKNQTIDLIEKLNDVGLVKYKDAREKSNLITKVIKEYDGDTFITLVDLITDSNHITTLRDAFNQLSAKTKEALIYTALVHRFGLLMPASILQRLLSKSWEEFTKEVLEYDCKGILINEVINNRGIDPDLFLKTKHPILADVLIKNILYDEDARYQKYSILLKHFEFSQYNATLIVDLLKAIHFNKDMSIAKINALYDQCSQEFSDDPHFALHYAINLQLRKNEEFLLEGIEILKYGESISERRNDRLIHRRAVLNFHLARRIFKRETELNKTIQYLMEAKDLFKIKLALDPFSHYSYVDYLRLEIWILESVEMDKIEKAKQITLIESIFRQAEMNVLGSAQFIATLKADFIRKAKFAKPDDELEYLKYLEEMYEDDNLKPYSLILMYYYYENCDEPNRCNEIFEDLKEYEHLEEVAKLLFKHCGKHLEDPNNIKYLFELINSNPALEKQYPVLYHYYYYIAEAYNKSFYYAYEHIKELRSKFSHINPTVYEVWKSNETGEAEIFEGIIKTQKNFTRVKITELQQRFNISNADYSEIDLSPNSKHKVNLHFHLTGIRAKILN